MSATPRNRRRRGITLPEVLAAMALAGIVLPIAMRGIVASARTADTARRRLEAAALAQSRLDELIAHGSWRDAQSSGLPSFSTADADEQMSVQESAASGGYELIEEAEPFLEGSLWQVTVTVTWLEARREVSVSLTTLVNDAESFF